MNDNNNYNNDYENNEINQDIQSEPNIDKITHTKNIKKVILPLVIGLFTMIALIIGATWAFFTVQITSKVTATTANATAPKRPLVTLSGGATLSMDISVADMSPSSGSKDYYANVDGKSTTSVSPEIASITLEEDDINTYTCNYTITATAAPTSKTLISAYTGKTDKLGELTLVLNGETYDLAEASNNAAILGETGIVKEGTVDVSVAAPGSLNAQLHLKNTDTDQASYLQNTSATINVQVALVSCNLKTTS